MSGDKFNDNTIKSALAFDEGRVDINYKPLESAKRRLYDCNSDRRINMKSMFTKGKIRLSIVFALIFVFMGGALGVGATQLIRTDKIDHPFISDPAVIGKWESVDYVSFMNDFVPGQSHVSEELYLKELAFVKDGRLLAALNEGNEALSETLVTWTEGLILNNVDITACKYEVREIDGNTYMFMEWKTGDYVYREMEPKYYVLKKVDSNDYSGYESVARTDNIDYPFVDDPQVIGTWESVDFVRTIDSFDPQKESWLSDLFLKAVEFKEGGKWTGKTTKGDYEINWTKGLILNTRVKTASVYTIKEMDGAIYMFYEWKSGDYTIRGMDPYYYVLKKK